MVFRGERPGRWTDVAVRNRDDEVAPLLLVSPATLVEFPATDMKMVDKEAEKA
jgi:hypothetical protein